MIGLGPNSCCLLGHVTGLVFRLYVKIFLHSIFNCVDFCSSMSCIVLDIELTDKNIIKELGLFIDGSVQGLSFFPPKTFKPKKQTTWNTNHLHGNAWSSGKLDYDKLFAVFYDIKVMNAKVFAKRFERCRLLPPFSDKMYKIWMTMVAQKFKILSKRTVCATALVTLYDIKQGFPRPRGKQRCMEKGLCNICKFCTCLLCLCLLLIYFFQLDMIFSIAFVLRN